ncbi:hypothetical protein [Hominenteromicrobium sp.]|uniref:hypothetical protein n=1 Tax=Hominenteromicrobium sp. TaxID=3073581 RepID=UPI003A939A2F
MDASFHKSSLRLSFFGAHSKRAGTEDDLLLAILTQFKGKSNTSPGFFISFAKITRISCHYPEKGL